MTLTKMINHYSQQVPYVRQIVITVVVIMGITAVGLTYRWYTHKRIAQAQQALAQAIELFNDSRGTSDVKWKEIDEALANGYSAYGNTALGGYFLAFASESALYQGRIDEARELLAKALKNMSCSMPLYNEYVIKLASMNMNSSDKTLFAEGKNTLQSLIDNAKNKDRGMAAYYLGLYFFEHGERAAAQDVWSLLMKDTHQSQTVWATLAQAKLDYLL